VSVQAAYYAYVQDSALVRGRQFAFVTRAALDTQPQDILSASLLAERMALAPQARVLVLYAGTGLIGAVAATLAREGSVTLLDHHAVAVEASRQTLAANQVHNARAELCDGAQLARGRTFDTVLALLPKGRAAWEQTVIDAAAVLRPGGDFFLAGANRAGIKSAARFVESVFGHVDTLAYKGGCRVVRAVKGPDTAIPSSDYYEWRQVNAQVGPEQLTYISKPGLFSWEQLDDGTRLLIEALQQHSLRSDDSVLDIGCGSGVLTLVAARQARTGSALGVDVDVRAVEATRRTIELNGLANASALLSDCGEAVVDRTFSAIVTNPPFHRAQATTYAIAEQIIRDAARLLRHRGRLYLVANAFLRYRPIIENAFGRATLLRQTNRYNVWYAEKRH